MHPSEGIFRHQDVAEAQSGHLEMGLEETGGEGDRHAMYRLTGSIFPYPPLMPTN